MRFCEAFKINSICMETKCTLGSDQNLVKSSATFALCQNRTKSAYFCRRVQEDDRSEDAGRRCPRGKLGEWSEDGGWSTQKLRRASRKCPTKIEKWCGQTLVRKLTRERASEDGNEVRRAKATVRMREVMPNK